MSNTDKIPFSLKDPQWDENTFWGRFESFRASVNPLHAFYTNNKINQFRSLVQEQEKAEAEQVKENGNSRIPKTPEEIKKLRVAQLVLETAVHPDTNKLIPWTCRFSSFIPMNLPLEYGFIMAPPTPFNTIFWQWMN